ncbi:MAG: hypothetical protein JJ913_17425 [Rhizobiaceae bacterium]|nr:hypothetical protein [Rhizobiaceae bacterium]
MVAFIRKSSILFALGAFGGLVTALVMWLSGVAGVTGLFGVTMAPPLTGEFIYPKVVWGGLWGWLGFLPLIVTGWVPRGVLISLIPTAVAWFYFLPSEGAGLLGLSLGLLTPIVVLAFTMVWGLVTEGLAEMCGVYRPAGTKAVA